MPYETFDIDLREGKAREDAFVHTMLRSRVEHKRDKKAWRTGNVALEMKQRCRDGSIQPSGVYKESDTFAVEFAPECWVLLPTEYARSLAEKAEREGKCVWIGDGGNHYNALVPLEWFVDAKSFHSQTQAVAA